MARPKAPTGETLTWLHLSDLHACHPETGWDAAQVVTALVEDLQAMRDEHKLRPDLIFFTGDAAFGHLGDGGRSLPSQFEEAEQLFQKVRDLFDIPLDRFFVVPGNHDIHRGRVPKQLTYWLDTAATADEVIDLIRKGGHDWAQYMERLEDYRAFLQSKDYDHLLGDPERLIYTQIRDIRGLKVGVAGFNTAWSCCRNAEKGRLWFGSRWQVPKLRTELKEADFRIALTHHPSNWFGEAEDPAAERDLARDFHVHLHGHEHRDWVQESADGHARIAAGACYAGSKDEKGYNFVRLEVEQLSGRIGRGEVWLREYNDRGARWVPGRIGGKTDKDGRWALGGGKIPVRRRKAQPKSSPLEACIVPGDFAPAVADVFVGRAEQLESLRSYLLSEEWNGRPWRSAPSRECLEWVSPTWQIALPSRMCGTSQAATSA
ncbi:MAG TPA: metallophosphoesterase [Thermoanaerobaculia bacterium]|nr:metallophosphoesterase [Thermoanaerobaculia bacterium]